MGSRWIVGLVLWCIASSSCTAHEDDVDRAKCQQLRDRLIDLRLADVAPTSATPHEEQAAESAVSAAHAPKALPKDAIDLEAHRAAMKQALGEDFLTACQKTMTTVQLKCALSAADSVAAAACGASK